MHPSKLLIVLAIQIPTSEGVHDFAAAETAVIAP